MNLMTQAIENIYKFGNTTLHLGRYNCNIIFNVGDNNRLNIRVELNYGNLIDTYDLNVEDGLVYIAYLVYYSFINYARKEDNVYLTSNISKEKENLTIVAINKLYAQLMPMISIKRNNIESLVKSRSYYDTFANLSGYVDNNSKLLSVRDILKTLIDESDKFERTLYRADSLWKKIGNEKTEVEQNEAFNKWNDFLNLLYIEQFNTSSKNNLDNININFEFLTSKNYLSNPAVDCDEEIEELELALLTPSKSAILVGPPGVGKTAIVEGLAYRICMGQVPAILKNKQILKINTSSIVRGCYRVGDFEEKVEKIMEYLSENPDIILFIDEIHTVIGAGLGSHGNLDLANIMKPYIDRGQVKVIGATTLEEYEGYVKSDKAFNRRFQKILISEPQKNSLYEIMKENIVKLEKMTGVKWGFDTETSNMIIKHIVECTDEKCRVYNDKRYNPDISLTILENAFARSLLRENDGVTIDNISDAIRKSDFLYESTRTISADKLLSKYQAIIPMKSVDSEKCRVLKFSVKKY